MSTASVTIDAYAILGVGRDASIQDINFAYKRLALKFHPDKAGDTAAAVERFRKIKDAVEVLRDEGHPEDDPGTWAYRPTYNRPSKRERHGFDYNYWPGQFTESARQYSPSYYYSYGTSVHMDPESSESKAKRAQFQADNVQWEKEWAGVDTEVQKARAKFRKERMRARMKRDLADMAKDTGEDTKHADILDDVAEGVLEDLDFGYGHKFKDFVLPEEDIKTCNPSDTFDKFAYEYAKEFRHDGERPIYSDCASSHSTASNNFSADFSTSSNSPSYTGSAHEYWTFKSTTEGRSANSTNYAGLANEYWSFNLTVEDSSPNPTNYAHSTNKHSNFKPTAKYSSGNTTDDTHSASNHSTFKPAAEGSKSTTANADADTDAEAEKLINSYMVGHDSLRPLTPFFKRKLADPHGRYTIDDLAGELNGLMLESYCGWLEDVRLSIPNASPMKVRTSPSLCSHLGYWYKEFCRPICDACNMWMPTFILTCPGCGVKACVRCKFADCGQQ
ncbi:uncharacterized protein N7479_004730 [Penicillium vulpinum]|uniref:uncharacterized protein n=1 Tax=Penicillium vulpinum TaxID=29845 RepID=UPI0025471689|nr:uncharacterized protein N7479_004730 [Penicillium vulpinum]KAJ5964854.1 hypothetical protein N7479_004730 [Penicillium vulpinum]